MEQEEISNYIIKFIRTKKSEVFVLLILLLVGILSSFYIFYIQERLNFNNEIKTGNLENINLIKEDSMKIKDKYIEMVREMSLEMKIGQILLTSLDGEIITEAELNLLKEGSVSGFLLFSKNVKDEEQVKKLTFEIDKTASFSGFFPIVAVDQEGGRVNRIDFVEKTGQEEIKTLEKAYEVGFARGKQLKELGIWMNFSPVVECKRNESRIKNQELRMEEEKIGEKKALEVDSFINRQNRGFLNDCSNLALEMIKGYKEAGIFPVAKHFPDGLTLTNQDPHIVLPEIDLERKDFDLGYYQTLINGGLEALMVTHLRYPKVDNEATSKSQIFIRDILRGELGFDGLIVIDDLSMNAIKDNYDLGEFVIESVKVGGDLFIISERKDYEEVFEYLVRNGEMDLEFKRNLNEAVGRILKIKDLE